MASSLLDLPVARAIAEAIVLATVGQQPTAAG